MPLDFFNMNYHCMSRLPNSCRIRIIKLIVWPLNVLKDYWKLRYSFNYTKESQVLKQILET